MRVIVNPSGRMVFVGLTLGLLVLVALVVIGTFHVEPDYRWLPGVGAFISGLAFILLMGVSFSGMMYALRLMNVALLLVMGMACGVVDILLYQLVESPPTTIIFALTAVTSYIMFFAGILFSDAHSDLAHRMHPYIADADLGDITLTGHQHKHGRRRIRHREVSIFEDWPAPIPFPVQALYTYKSTTASELSFSKGDQLIILDCRGNWWQAENPRTSETGFVPSNYLLVLQKAKVSKTYEAKDQDEVTIIEGQVIEVMEIHEFMCLVRSVEGKIGSVPTENLDVDPINLRPLSLSTTVVPNE